MGIIELTSSFVHNPTMPIKIRKIGKIVEINGACNPAIDDGILGDGNWIDMATLPSEYKPSANICVGQLGKPGCNWRGLVQTNSTLRASGHMSGENYVPATTTHTLYVHIVYTVD
jgi:hypothetical protein